MIGTYSQTCTSSQCTLSFLGPCNISPHFDDWLPTCFIYALKCIRAPWCTELCGVLFLRSPLLLLTCTAFLSIKRRTLACLNTERSDHYPHCLVFQLQKEKRLKVGHDYGIPHALQSTICEYRIDWHRVRNLIPTQGVSGLNVGRKSCMDYFNTCTVCCWVSSTQHFEGF